MKSIASSLIGVALAGLLLSSPLAAAPEAPRIESMLPRGLARGATRAITLAGTALGGADGVLIQRLDARGDPIFRPDPTLSARIEATTATSARLQLMAQPDALPGPRRLRLMTPAGLSNPFTFDVVLHAEQLEVEPNQTAAQATRATPPTVLEGTIATAEDIDTYRIPARAGETLLFLLQTFPGSTRPTENLDPQLTLRDGSGRLLATGAPHRGLGAVLTHAPTSTGDLLVEVRDQNYRGGLTFQYRLAAGTTPLLTGIFPLGGAAGRNVTLTPKGVNLGPVGSAPFLLRLAADAPEEIREVRVETPEGPSNPLPFAVDHLLEATEQEPNEPPDPPQAVTLPIAINGRADQPGDIDVFRFTGQAGQRIVADALAARLGAEYDAYLTLQTDGGEVFARNDDADGTDARLDVTLPTTARYLLRIRNMRTDQAGPTCAYRILLRPPAPDFRLSPRPDAITLPRGGSTELKVKLTRIDAWDGPVSLVVSPPPSLRGIAAEPVTVAAGATEARFTLTATPDTPTGHFMNVFIRATARVDNQLVTRETPVIVTVSPQAPPP